MGVTQPLNPTRMLLCRILMAFFAWNHDRFPQKTSHLSPGMWHHGHWQLKNAAKRPFWTPNVCFSFRFAFKQSFLVPWDPHGIVMGKGKMRDVCHPCSLPSPYPIPDSNPNPFLNPIPISSPSHLRLPLPHQGWSTFPSIAKSHMIIALFNFFSPNLGLSGGYGTLCPPRCPRGREKCLCGFSQRTLLHSPACPISPFINSQS